MVRVVRPEAVDVGEQWFGGESVDAGVDLARLLLRFCKRLLFHDGLDAMAAGSGAKYPPVTERVVGLSGQNRHSSVAVDMKVADAGDGFGADQRHVAGEHQDVLIALRLIAHTHN